MGLIQQLGRKLTQQRDPSPPSRSTTRRHHHRSKTSSPPSTYRAHRRRHARRRPSQFPPSYSMYHTLASISVISSRPGTTEARSCNVLSQLPAVPEGDQPIKEESGEYCFRSVDRQILTEGAANISEDNPFPFQYTEQVSECKDSSGSDHESPFCPQRTSVSESCISSSDRPSDIEKEENDEHTVASVKSERWKYTLEECDVMLYNILWTLLSALLMVYGDWAGTAHYRLVRKVALLFGVVSLIARMQWFQQRIIAHKFRSRTVQLIKWLCLSFRMARNEGKHVVMASTLTTASND